MHVLSTNEVGNNEVRWGLRVMIQKGGVYLVILVGSDGYELGFGVNKSSKCSILQLHNVTGTYKMEPWLVLVHRVQNCLKQNKPF